MIEHYVPTKLVQIKSGWHEAGRSGTTLGPDVKIGSVLWTPVLWDDPPDEDPDWHKTVGLELRPEKKPDRPRRRGK